MNEKNLNNTIVSVVREFKWPPDIIGGLFFDREDYEGLFFWMDDVLEMNADMKAKMPEKK